MGYLVVQALAHALGWQFKEERQFLADIAKGKIGGTQLHLLLPLTYMNESGQALRRCLDYYKLEPKNVIVIVDDVDLDYGQMRVRTTGSAGGHNGLKSIQACLHTQHYVRLRMGIGIEKKQGTLADYVLDAFSEEEKQRLPEFISEGVKILQRLISEEVTVVMNSVNIRRKVKVEDTEKTNHENGPGEKT